MTDGLRLARALAVRGEAELAMGQTGRAIASVERSLALHGPTPASLHELGYAKYVLARALWQRGGQRRRAVSLAQEAYHALESGGSAEPNIRLVRRWLELHRR